MNVTAYPNSQRFEFIIAKRSDYLRNYLWNIILNEVLLSIWDPTEHSLSPSLSIYLSLSLSPFVDIFQIDENEFLFFENVIEFNFCNFFRNFLAWNIWLIMP